MEDGSRISERYRDAGAPQRMFSSSQLLSKPSKSIAYTAVLPLEGAKVTLAGLPAREPREVRRRGFGCSIPLLDRYRPIERMFRRRPKEPRIWSQSRSGNRLSGGAIRNRGKRNCHYEMRRGKDHKRGFIHIFSTVPSSRAKMKTTNGANPAPIRLPGLRYTGRP